MRGAVVLISFLALAVMPAAGQPDLSGVWQVLNTAAWDIQDHSGQLGVPPGQGVVEGNEIPYLPSAAAKKLENFARRATADPAEANCFLPSVPRATYMPFPFEIVQTPRKIAIAYEFAHALRTIPLDGSSHPEGLPDTWMGDSRGHWEGKTLVVDTTNFNGKGWISTSAAGGRIKGIPESPSLHLVERFTHADPNTILYELTVDDPEVYTKPWKVSMPLTRDDSYKIYEYACHEGNEAVGNILRGGRILDKNP